MKTYKHIWYDGKLFNYQININITHGFWNNRNSWIGYFYKDQVKGFWLIEEK